jgi:hypothetical protein
MEIVIAVSAGFVGGVIVTRMYFAKAISLGKTALVRAGQDYEKAMATLRNLF